MGVFHLLKYHFIFLAVKRADEAWPSSPASAACPVKIVTHRFRKVKIDDVANKWDVETPRCEISRDQYLSAFDLCPKVFKVSLPDSRWDVAMHRGGFYGFLSQGMLDGTCAIHRIAEDNAACVVLSRILLELFDE